MNRLEEFEKKLGAPKDVEKEDLEDLLAGIEDWVIISPESGYVRVVGKGKVSDKTRIHLILATRYLYHELQVALNRENQVKAEVSVDELEKMLRINRKSLNNRIIDLRNDGYLTDKSRGVVIVTAYSIKTLVKELSSNKGAN